MSLVASNGSKGNKDNSHGKSNDKNKSALASNCTYASRTHDRASLHIIAHKIRFFDVIKLIVNFFLYFRSLNDLKCIDYEKENQHHLRTIGLAT